MARRTRCQWGRNNSTIPRFSPMNLECSRRQGRPVIWLHTGHSTSSARADSSSGGESQQDMAGLKSPICLVRTNLLRLPDNGIVFFKEHLLSFNPTDHPLQMLLRTAGQFKPSKSLLPCLSYGYGCSTVESRLATTLDANHRCDFPDHAWGDGADALPVMKQCNGSQCRHPGIVLIASSADRPQGNSFLQGTSSFIDPLPRGNKSAV